MVLLSIDMEGWQLEDFQTVHDQRSQGFEFSEVAHSLGRPERMVRWAYEKAVAAGAFQKTEYWSQERKDLLWELRKVQGKEWTDVNKHFPERKKSTLRGALARVAAEKEALTRSATSTGVEVDRDSQQHDKGSYRPTYSPTTTSEMMKALTVTSIPALPHLVGFHDDHATYSTLEAEDDLPSVRRVPTGGVLEEMFPASRNDALTSNRASESGGGYSLCDTQPENHCINSQSSSFAGSTAFANESHHVTIQTEPGRSHSPSLEASVQRKAGPQDPISRVDGSGSRTAYQGPASTALDAPSNNQRPAISYVPQASPHKRSTFPDKSNAHVKHPELKRRRN